MIYKLPRGRFLDVSFKTWTKVTLALSAVASLAVGLALPSAAQTATANAPTANAPISAGWPQKPIRIIVPNPAGGTADLLPRLLTEPLAARLGQPVIIENRAGAAGNSGVQGARSCGVIGRAMAGSAVGSAQGVIKGYLGGCEVGLMI